MKTPVKTVMLFAVAAGAAATRLAAAPIQFPLEWNPTYDTSVPCEVEISPAKLQKLAGADPAAGFSVTAQTANGAKRLDVVTLPGRAKGTVRLRFTVPEKTASLVCAAKGVPTPRKDSAILDNLFAGALSPDALPKWKTHKSVKAAVLPGGGIALRGSQCGNFEVSYAVPVPDRLAGKPVAFELDVTSRTKMTWGGQIKLVQFDAAGRELPEYAVDPRCRSSLDGSHAPLRQVHTLPRTGASPSPGAQGGDRVRNARSE